MMRTAMTAGHIGSAELKDLVAREATLRFSIPVSSLERLSALAPRTGAAAVEPAGVLEASLSFQPGAEGFPCLRLVVTGTTPLVCQRCLELLVWPAHVDVRLTMVGDDAEAARLADPFDTVLLEEGELPVGRLVEDEVLAALPLAPKHGANTPCGATGADDDAGTERGETHRPMAGLADLLGQGGRRDDN